MDRFFSPKPRLHVKVLDANQHVKANFWEVFILSWRLLNMSRNWKSNDIVIQSQTYFQYLKVLIKNDMGYVHSPTIFSVIGFSVLLKA